MRLKESKVLQTFSNQMMLINAIGLRETNVDHGVYTKH